MSNLVSIVSRTAVERFHCPVCGATVFDEEGGLSESYCPHTVAFVDWAGELHISPVLELEDGPDEDELDEMWKEAGDVRAFFEQLLGELPAPSVAFVFEEEGRGGGHEGSVAGACIVFGP